MGSVSHIMEPAPAGDSIACSDCDEVNPTKEIFCSSCGASLERLAGDAVSPVLKPLKPGVVLDGRYCIDSVVGKGAENRYQAHSVSEEDRVVLISERPLDSKGLADDGVASSSQLAEQVKGVEHPALLLTSERFLVKERTYAVRPWQSGISLSRCIGKTLERHLIGWGMQLCQAIAILHRNRIFCVEVPPENIILDEEGRLHISEFSALRPSDHCVEYPSLTDGYGAPESYKPETLSPAADVFAVGACLYSLLVGRRLAVEGWAVEPEEPAFYPDKVVSQGLESVLRRALQFHPENRYQSVGELKEALLSAQKEATVLSAGISDVGLVREHNEDAIIMEERGSSGIDGRHFRGLYVLSDGMGGAEAGEVASRITTCTIVDELKVDSETLISDDGHGILDELLEQQLRNAVELANGNILKYGVENPEAAGLGATVVAALIQNGSAVFASVGDSRIYVLNRGKLKQVTTDHSLVARLVEIGQLTEEEALVHEHRNVLIRSLGSKKDVVVDTSTLRMNRGSKLLLCSDGLTGHVSDTNIADILSRHRDPHAAAREMIAAANDGGGVDNTSVVVVFYE